MKLTFDKFVNFFRTQLKNLAGRWRDVRIGSDQLVGLPRVSSWCVMAAILALVMPSPSRPGESLLQLT